MVNEYPTQLHMDAFFFDPTIHSQLFYIGNFVKSIVHEGFVEECKRSISLD